jgi:L-rhamnose isomerase
MNTDPKTLAKLETDYRGYLEGDRLEQFFEEFDIKFSAGHWSAGDFFDRFAPVGYNSNDSSFRQGLIGQIERVAAAGIKAIEFHQHLFCDLNGIVNDQTVAEAKAALQHYSVKCTTVNTNTWTHPKWKLGGCTNPDPAIRRDAIDQFRACVEVARKLGARCASLWPGSDGHDYNFQINYGRTFQWFIEGCDAFNRAAKAAGILFAIEDKPKEPREGNMVIQTVHKAAWVARLVNERAGGTNCGVTVDFGHQRMYNSEPADAVYFLRSVGIPLRKTDINAAKPHSNDEDRITGMEDNWVLADYLYATIDCGFDGYYSEDQFSYRDDAVAAMALSRELFANVMKRALLIWRDREVLLEAQSRGDGPTVIHALKRTIFDGEPLRRSEDGKVRAASRPAAKAKPSRNSKSRSGAAKPKAKPRPKPRSAARSKPAARPSRRR